MTAVDIVVVGTGPLAQLLGLAIQQVAPEMQVRLAQIPAEQRLPDTGPFAEVEILDHHSEAILQSLGLWPALANKSSEIGLLHISEQGRLGVTRFNARDLRFSAANSKEVLAHTISPADLQAQVAQRAERLLATARLDAELSGLVIAENGQLQVQLADESIATTLLIATDSAAAAWVAAELGQSTAMPVNNAVMLHSQIQFEQHTVDQVFVRFTSDGPMSLLAAPESKQAVLQWAVPQSVATELQTLDDEAFIARVQESFGWRLGRALSVTNRYVDAGHWQNDRSRSAAVVALGDALYRDPSSQWPWPSGLNRGLQDIAHLVDAIKAAKAGDAGSLQNLARQFSHQQAEQLQHLINNEAMLKRWFTSDLGPLNHLRGVALMGLGASASLKQMLLAHYGQQPRAASLECG